MTKRRAPVSTSLHAREALTSIKEKEIRKGCCQIHIARMLERVIVLRSRLPLRGASLSRTYSLHLDRAPALASAALASPTYPPAPTSRT
eukprot:1683645-Pleurochrysis_carterae.AAC.1